MTFLYFLAESIDGTLMRCMLFMGRKSPRGLIIGYNAVEGFRVYVLLESHSLKFTPCDHLAVPLHPRTVFNTCRGAVMDAKKRELVTRKEKPKPKPESIRARILLDHRFDMRDVESETGRLREASIAEGSLQRSSQSGTRHSSMSIRRGATRRQT
jgi:hypothetical protein